MQDHRKGNSPSRFVSLWGRLPACRRRSKSSAGWKPAPQLLGGRQIGRAISLAVALAAATVWAGPQSVLEREQWNLVRSDFALATQAAAGQLGDVRFHLPLPQCSRMPAIDGFLDDAIWSDATEVPLPCVRRGTAGRIVADARLLAARKGDRVFVAMSVPTRFGAGAFVSVESKAASKGLTVNVDSDGKVVGTLQGSGQNEQTVGLRLIAAAARVVESTVVELELSLPEGEVVVRPNWELLGIRPPHPLAQVKIRFTPGETAWRLNRVDGPPDEFAWQLSLGQDRQTSSVIAGSVTQCRAYGASASAGTCDVVINQTDAGSISTIRTPAAIGATLLRLIAEDPSGGPYSFVVATFVPDVERLLEQSRSLAGDPALRANEEQTQRIEQIASGLKRSRLKLGTERGQRVWDETYREVLRVRREIALSSPLLDFERLVFVKRHNFGGWDGFFGYTSYLKPPPAELCVLESVRTGQPVRTLLRTETGCVRDPDISFDGQRVLFAHARDPQDTYHLYEIGADGTGLRQLTTSPSFTGPEPAPRGVGFQDVEPSYLPSGDIAFTSTRYVRYVDCVGQGEPVTTLFVMDRDGRRLRGISANHVHDWSPSVLNDGRIIYTRWEYTDRSQMWSHQLFTKSPDGSATTNYYGSNSWWPVSMLHPRAAPGSQLVMCTLAGHHTGTDQAGEIAVIDRQRATEETGGVVALFPPRKIEANYNDDPRPANARYCEPYPLSDRHFIVAGRPPGCERFGLYLADVYGNCVLVYEDDTLDALSPMPLVARPVPPVIPPKADYRETTGLVSLIDIYSGPGLAGVERGTVKALRVVDFDLRDTPESGGLRQENGPSGGHSCPVSALGGSWHVKRILGTVPVHEDGSSMFRIPAERRVFFQPLDDNGRAVQTMRSWVELAPGESVTCVGCHERPGQSPLSQQTIAHARGPMDPTPWYGPARAFGFPREVQPVLDRHCVGCHNERDETGLDLRGDATNWFSLAYENLRPFVNPVGPQSPPGLLPPRSVGAIASPLVDMLLSGHYDVNLAREDLDRIITWIDLNIPYYDNTALTRPAGAFGNNSGRSIVSESDAKALWAALGDRCVACHKSGFRVEPASGPCQVNDLPKTLARPSVNLTHPEQSRLLTAPLARAAGGLGLCGGHVFSSRDDRSYVAALQVIQSWHNEMLARPREDMPGSVPSAAYTSTQAKREAWLQIENENRLLLTRERNQQ